MHRGELLSLYYLLRRNKSALFHTVCPISFVYVDHAAALAGLAQDFLVCDKVQGLFNLHYCIFDIQGVSYLAGCWWQSLFFRWPSSLSFCAPIFRMMMRSSFFNEIDCLTNCLTTFICFFSAKVISSYLELTTVFDLRF